MPVGHVPSRPDNHINKKVIIKMLVASRDLLLWVFKYFSPPFILLIYNTQEKTGRFHRVWKLSKLLQHVFLRLKENNMTSALVWILEENQSRFFFERMGAKVIVNKKDVTIGNKQLNMMGYRWGNI